MSDNRPKKLYKYVGLNEQVLSNLKNQVLFFQDIRNFNDPFEAFTEYEFDDPAHLSQTQKEELKKLFIHSIRQSKGGMYFGDIDSKKDRKIKQKMANLFETMHPDIIINRFNEEQLDKMFKEILNVLLKQFGVTCFSGSNNNILMWSHYGDSHRGICLEFDTSNDFFDELYIINYPKNDDRPVINMHEMQCSDTFYTGLFTTKYKTWAYEEEWRLFNKPGKTQKYPKEALTGIYFGVKVDESLRNTVCLILQKQNPDAKFYQGELSSTKYEVKFTEFEFMDNERKSGGQQAETVLQSV